MAMRSFGDWRDISEGDMADGASTANSYSGNPMNYLKSLKKGVRGLDDSLMKRAIPFIQSLSDLDPVSKMKILGHVLSATGVDPAQLMKLKQQMKS